MGRMGLVARKRKIAYIITLPDLGGAQSHVYDVITNIGAYGYEPLLITGKAGWLTDKVSAEGIAFHIVPDLVRPISPLHDMKAVRAIKKILQDERPALVHCHSSKAGIIGRIAAYSCNIPAVFTAHGWAFTEGVHPLKRRLYAFIENLAACWTEKIICVSEYDRRLGARYLPRHRYKMVTIHNGIPDRPEMVRDWEKHPAGEPFNIIVVARFSPPKKNIEILRYLRGMLDSGLKVTVTFVGDGPLLGDAKAEAKRLQLEKEALFLGARTDVAELLPKCDVFLLLSHWEGFPISILEAMRAGLPVIASDVGGVKEAVEHGETGYLLRDDAELVGCIKKLYAKSSINDVGMAGRKSFVENFSVEKMMRMIVEGYDEINCRSEVGIAGRERERL